MSTRRDFFKHSAAAAAGLIVMPTIVPSSVFGKNAPSNRINIGAIGMGRIARNHNLPGLMKHAHAHILAVSDLDSKRIALGKEFVEKYYSEKRNEKYNGVLTFGDYREMLSNKDIDAVVISTPDHWHAKNAIDAAIAGKHVYLEKPCTLTMEEGRTLSNIVHRTGIVFQLGTQQRSSWQFQKACELVRNGKIGDIKTVKVGLPIDPAGDEEPVTAIPENLNYDMWLGNTQWMPYIENRVHSQSDVNSRPGWLRVEQFCLGMITGWGVHHMDIVHWGLGTEHTGPVEVDGKAIFPTKGIWTVHGKYNVEAKYANGVAVTISDEFPNGVRFEGTNGWIFVNRGNEKMTASDPNKNSADSPLQASDTKILTAKTGEGETKLYISKDHHGNWLECIRSGQQTISPVEVGHRSTAACIVSHIAMKLGRKLTWDPIREHFKNDDEANALLAKDQRPPYSIEIK